MSTNPFEDQNGTYHVLVNAENQHSLWPVRIAVPDGWEVALEGESRDKCLEFIEKNWKDMRPRSLSVSD
ncbi:MbtH family protein [Streptomyces sp. NPDC059755]|uniref:MbtH family protein n=1 Tax=Streptomyces sp. NPDC059755 TaxID=3346934 RepID=UPI00365D1193